MIKASVFKERFLFHHHSPHGNRADIVRIVHSADITRRAESVSAFYRICNSICTDANDISGFLHKFSRINDP